MSSYYTEHGDTRHRILLAARREFADKGFSGARMSTIAKNAGVNQALLHYYYSSKTNIYINVFQKLMGSHYDKYIKQFNDELGSWNVKADIKLCGMLFAMIKGRMYVHDKELQRIVFHEIAEGKGVIYELLKHYLQPQISDLAELIKEGIEQGIFEISDTLLASFKYISFINHISHWTESVWNTHVNEELPLNNHELLYDFMTELVFKELLPQGKKLNIPILNDYRKERINSILEEIKNDINT